VEKKPRLATSTDSASVTLAPTFARGGIKGTRKQQKKQKRQHNLLPEPCSAEDVLWRDVISVLGQSEVDLALEEGSEWDAPFESKTEVELEVSALSSSGEHNFSCCSMTS
jgi:tRNA (uracil-5-)-methyltransferase